MHGQLSDLKCFAKFQQVNLKQLFDESKSSYSLIKLSFVNGNVQIIEEVLMEGVLPSSPEIILCAHDHQACDKFSSLIVDQCHHSPMFTEIEVSFCKTLMECVVNCNMTFLLKGIVRKFPKSTDSCGRNLLHYACLALNLELANILLNDNAHLQNEADKNNQLPIHVACKVGFCLEKQIEMINLVSSNCDINAQDKDGNTPLHLVYDLYPDCFPLMEYLYKKRGCSVTIKNNAGLMLLKPLLRQFPPLFNVGDAVFSSLDDNAQLNELLDIACKAGHASLVEYLITSKGRAIDIPNADGHLPLHSVIMHQHRICNPDVLFYLLQLISSRVINMPNAEEDTALHIACKYLSVGQYSCSIIGYLINTRKADVNIPNGRGKLPLHCIASARNYSFEIEDLLDLVCTDLADINAKDADGNTALHLACRGRTFDERIVLHLLQEKNASVNVRNNKGDMPFHSLFLHFFEVNKVDFLVNQSIIPTNIDAQDGKGNTLLHLACFSGVSSNGGYRGKVSPPNESLFDRISVSVAAGNRCDFWHLSPNVKILDEMLALITWILSIQSSSLLIQNNEGMIPLHCHLVCQSSTDTNMLILKLLTTNDGLLIQDKEGNIPLHYASHNEEDYRSFVFLLTSNFPVFFSKIPPENSKTLFDYLGNKVYKKLPPVNSLKLRGNAFDMICIKNNKGHSPLQRFIERDNLDMLTFIIELFPLKQKRYGI